MISKIFLMFVVIFVLAIGAVYTVFIKDKPNQIAFSFKGVTLSVQDYKSIQEKFENDPYVEICNIDSGD